MRILFLLFIVLTIPSCAGRRYTDAGLLPNGIRSLTEETYAVAGHGKKLLHKKEITFTRSRRIKYSETFDASGNLLKKTEKKLWFTEESYPAKEPYYCKIRWKPGRRERISCYTKKRYKQNESIYHYNKDGTTKKIEDRFAPFYTRHFYYNSNGLSNIITTAENEEVIDEISVECTAKDEKGTCLKATRTSSKTGKKEEILTFPDYN